MIESRRVYLPEEANWLADFEAEITAFPAGRYDDQVDAITQFLNGSQTHQPWDRSMVPNLRMAWG